MLSKETIKEIEEYEHPLWKLLKGQKEEWSDCKHWVMCSDGFIPKEEYEKTQKESK